MFTRTLSSKLNRWTVSTGLVALTLTIPVLYVVASLFDPAGKAWTQVVSGLLPNYAFNSLTLLIGVGALTLLIGPPAAWLVVVYRFPGSTFFGWALVLPLAIPRDVTGNRQG